MKKLIAALAATVFSTFAWAEAPAFTQADANSDGVVSMEEARAALPDMDEATIIAADADNDGSLSEAEYTALTAA